MDKLILLITITTFSIVILSGTTLNLSGIIQTKLKSDETTSNRDNLEGIMKTYKVLAWIGALQYLSILYLFGTRINFTVATIVLFGYILKYVCITSDSKKAHVLKDKFIEHPLSVTLDVLTNLGIAIQLILIFMQL